MNPRLRRASNPVMKCTVRSVAGPAVALALAGCGPAPPPVPSVPSAPVAPSVAASATPAAPTPAPDDPLRAALARLLEQPWGVKTDRFRTLDVRFPDAATWRRVRFFGYPSRAGFRYTDEHWGIAIVDYADAEGDDSPEACLRRFLKHAARVAESFEVEAGPIRREWGRHRFHGRVHAMPIARIEGRFVTLTNRDRYVGAVAAYRSWPDTCLVQGFAVLATPHADLAEAVVDRWIREGAGGLSWRRGVRRAPPRENR
ncbi:MAG: hypothetical protein HY744_11005 [Deltaproteobacteria bacterium]|nr:hypothetical protein [Deltaproteobacteria bacterium]